MADDASQSAVSSSLASIEANVIIAGAEIASGVWIVYRASVGQCITPAPTGEWHWSFALYAVVAFLALVLAGFALEALAGILERIATRPLWGASTQTPWSWYLTFTQHPSAQQSLSAQKWMWKSGQAHQEFSRRRLRILVSRNTAAFALLLTAAWLALVQWSFLIFAGGVLGFALFSWLWLDAQKGWNMAVTAAAQLGEP